MSIYDITIAGVSGAAPSDGFIDPTTVYQYNNISSTDHPTSYANSLAKSRANRRHKNVVNAVQFYSALQIISVTPNGSPNASTAPTSIVYRVSVPDINSVMTKDENNPPAALTGQAAVTRIFARALSRFETIMLDVLDPTTNNAPGVNNATAYARAGTRFNVETVGALYGSIAAAEGGVSIVLVSQ